MKGKYISTIWSVITAIFILWVALSWFEVIAKNGNENPIYLPINFFVLLTEINP